LSRARRSTAENFSPARDGIAVDERQRDETGRTGAMLFAAAPCGEASHRSTIEAARRPRREVSLPRVRWRIVAGLRELFCGRGRAVVWIVAGALSAFASACATGGADDSTGDAQVKSDGTAPSDGGSCPTGYTGPTCSSCAGGFHACGTSCEQDHPNSPDAGCTQGCNSAPCPVPQNATAKCTSDGKCDYACQTSFDKTDGGCACPSGDVVCSGVCQQCCNDSDCPGHQLCNGGVCGGCQAGWGDCNGSPSDGCETHLNSSGNCGSCGHSCCGSFCGCGFLGVGGESCNVSGNSFACGC
jgi:hypothetical protein